MLNDVIRCPHMGNLQALQLPVQTEAGMLGWQPCEWSRP